VIHSYLDCHACLTILLHVPSYFTFIPSYNITSVLVSLLYLYHFCTCINWLKTTLKFFINVFYNNFQIYNSPGSNVIQKLSYLEQAVPEQIKEQPRFVLKQPRFGPEVEPGIASICPGTASICPGTASICPGTASFCAVLESYRIILEQLWVVYSVLIHVCSELIRQTSIISSKYVTRGHSLVDLQCGWVYRINGGYTLRVGA